MKLRKLKESDATRMLEWMHDPDTTEFLNTNFCSKTLQDCKDFISAEDRDEENLHLAVTDTTDIYMGTVSLKKIDSKKSTAEFAITMHPSAQGKGMAGEAMQAILDKGIRKLGIQNIFWCVRPDNKRAVRFYDKNGYTRTNTVSEEITKSYEMPDKYIWYVYRGNRETK